MATFHFTDSHEYIREEEGSYFLGITGHAQQELGDITYVDLPEVGASYSAGESCSTVESVKAVAEIYAPVDLKVASVNEELEDTPELINQDAQGKGWLMAVELSNAADLESLMDQEAYDAMEK